MQCPTCKTKNPTKKKFCGKCGAKLVALCPNCQAENPPDDKFCGDCGYDLSVPATKVPQPPKEETHPTILITDHERKYVTVLFSDLSGYTAMTEKLDPEEVKEIMGRIFGEIAQVVVKYEGFIEKFVGDAILALFGVPKTHEDDPVRAIRAAREIHELVRRMSPPLEKRIGRSLYMHTGINTGLVVTGELNLEKGTHGVLGDTINMASRLSGLAKTDEIIVGLETHHQAEGYFNFETIEPAKVKGKEEDILTYKVLSPKEAPTKTHRLSGVRAELIGRRVEMRQLKEAVDNLKQGRSSIFSIVGDPGTGKSRLVEEFRNSLDLAATQWREGHAYAYSQNIPYFPLIDLLNRAWQIKEGDPPEQVRQKVEKGTKALIADREELVPYMGSLYSLPYPETEQVGPETWKARLHEAMQLIVTNLCKRAPTIVCIEDLHWADPSSIELLKNILTDLKFPVLFICIYRPSFSLFTSHLISSLRTYQEIRLQDLSSSESQDMVESLLKTKDIPADLRKFIQDKVEGNPFYLEEAINALIESDVLVQEENIWKLTKPITEANIPYTVQGIISARLDRLERETKRILQEASVIGRSFLYDILRRITELKEHVDRSLNGLERLDLIRTRTLQPDLEYIFKHALTQEVVYNGILRKERQHIHEKIAQVMEELFHDRLPEFYETLAYHFRQGRSIIKAVDYLMKAAEKSFSRYAVDEAHEYYREAFDLLTSKSDKSKEENKLLVDLLLDWAVVYYHRGIYNELLDLFQKHKNLAISLEDNARLGMFYNWMGGALNRLERLRESYQYLSKALEIGKELGDEKITGYAYGWLIYTCADLGRLDEAVEFGEKVKALDVYKSDKELFRLSTVAMGGTYFFRGEGRKAHEEGDVLMEYGQKHSEGACITQGHETHGNGYMAIGDIPNAIECYKRTIQTALEPVFAITAKVFLGYAYVVNGQYAEAETVLNEVTELCEHQGYGFMGSAAKASSGIVMITKGNFEQGIEVVKDVMKSYINNESWWRYALVNSMLGRVYLQIYQAFGNMNDFSSMGQSAEFLVKTAPVAHEKAEVYLTTAIKKAKEIGASSIHGQSCLEMGRLHKLRGKTDDARKYIADAIHILEECEADVFLKQAKEELASL
ncbi:MAG: AAA family ATPase [Deltaproteobacteria bacterium]|nr:AAA family ATPase [Deltaproteobacteria bacterium]